MLRIIKTLYNAGIISAEEQNEYVQLIKKGFTNDAYYGIVWKKLIAENNKNSLPEAKQQLYQRLLNQLKPMME